MKNPQLILLHFAGGSAYSFQFLEPLLKDFDLIIPELPGRGRRINESLIIDFDTAARDLYKQIVQKLNGTEFLIYGHSMGAYMALRIANMLEKENKNASFLFLSGNAGPGINENRNRYLLGYDDFIEELKVLGGFPKELLENKELLDFFEPILRSDFRIVETMNLETEAAVNTPIFAMMGDEEEDVGSIANWSRFTHATFGYDIFKGGHFFIHEHPGKIARVIKDNYRTTV